MVCRTGESVGYTARYLPWRVFCSTSLGLTFSMLVTNQEVDSPEFQLRSLNPMVSYASPVQYILEEEKLSPHLPALTLAYVAASVILTEFQGFPVDGGVRAAHRVCAAAKE